MVEKVIGRAIGGLGALGLLAVLAGAAPCGAAEKSEVLLDRYYKVSILGKRFGYAHSVMTRRGEKVISELEMHMSVAKPGMRVEVKSDLREVETADGRPVQVTQSMQPVGLPIGIRGHSVFQGLTARYTRTEPINKKTVRTYRFKQLPLLSHGAALLLRRQGLRVGQTVKLVKYIPEYFDKTGAGQFVYRFEAEEDFPFLGVPMKVIRAKVECTDNRRLNGMVWLDRDGYEVKATMPDLANAVMVMTTKQQALRPVSADDQDGGVFAATLIKLGRPLEDYQTRENLTLVLRGKAAVADVLARTDHQEVRGGGNRVLVTIHRRAQAKSTATDEELGALTKPTDMIESDDPKIAALAAKLTAELSGPAEKAEAIRRYVGTHMKPGTAAGAGAMMDTAAQVIESMSGDCTEYAVLTAALCRAAGIPARLVMGVVYVPRFQGHRYVFGYHEWTEVHYDGRWHGLDATRPQPFDVGHVAFLVSDGNRLDPADMLRMASTMGQLRIRVVKSTSAPVGGKSK